MIFNLTKEVTALKIEIYQLKSSAKSSVISNQHIQAEATELRQVIHCLRNEISSFQEILDKIRGQNPVSVISEQVSQKQITQPTNSKLHIASTSISTLAQQEELQLQNFASFSAQNTTPSRCFQANQEWKSPEEDSDYEAEEAQMSINYLKEFPALPVSLQKEATASSTRNAPPNSTATRLGHCSLKPSCFKLKNSQEGRQEVSSITNRNFW